MPGTHLNRNLTLSLAVAVALTLAGPVVRSAGAVDRNHNRRFTVLDRDGDGRLGEADTIRARLRHELQTRGADVQAINPEKALERSKAYYEHWRAAGGGIRAMGISSADWISLGPNNGAGRFTAVAPHPTETGTVLAGAAGGGVWRTEDGGTTWTPLTDGVPNLSVGAVAYAPSDPNVVYVGTGEGGYGIDFIPGIGLLRSDDGGDTWTLPDQVVASQFYRINVDPRNPDVLLAGTNQGLLRSETGGATWTTPISASPGGTSRQLVVTDVVRSSQNPDHLYAALWCFDACPAGYGRVMESIDNGITWANASAGLPEAGTDFSLNRTAIALAPNNDRILYAVCEAEANSGSDPKVTVYKTRDGGAQWTKTLSPGAYLGQQGWYDNTLTVSPMSSYTVIGGGVYYVLSTTGGGSWISKNPYKGTPNLPHVDAHDLQWQAGTLWVATDGGIWKSTDNGITWTDCNSGLITRQFYSLAVDPVHRERVLAGAQDNGTNRRRDAGDNSWDQVIGGDGFECAINPLIPDVQYGTLYNVQVRRASPGAGFTDASPAFGVDEDTPFITPLTLRRDNPGTLYTGTTRVWKSTTGGDAWAPLGETVTNGTWSDDEIWSIATTPVDPRVLMVAKNRNLYRSEDGGVSWTLTRFGKNGLPNARVLNVEISPFDADEALACLAVRSGISLYRTTDGGLTWDASSSGLQPFSAQVARWDPQDPSTVYAGTDVGLYRSTDGGVTWQRFGNGLPAVSVQEIRILPDDSMMRVATHGRGVWGLNLPQPANQAPQVSITAPTDTLELAVGDSATFDASATDPDGDPIAATWVATDSWEMHDGGSGAGALTTTFDHTFNLGGTYTVAVNVRDSHGTPGVATIQVKVSDPADDCSSPRTIPADGPFPVVLQLSNAGATMAGDDPQPACVDGGQDDNAGRWGSMWFDFTPSEDGQYFFSTCGSGADTVLTAWTGAECGSYVQVAGACNDDDELEHCESSRAVSYLDLSLVSGTTYHIMVSSFSNDHRGPITLTVETPSETMTGPRRRDAGSPGAPRKVKLNRPL